MDDQQPDDAVTEEEVAAITAAIAACLDRPPAAVKLKSVREVQLPFRSLWSLAGRQVQHAERRLSRGRSRPK